MTHEELKALALQRSSVKAEYDALEEEFALLDKILQARQEAGLTQEEVARLESSRVFEKAQIAYLSLLEHTKPDPARHYFATPSHASPDHAPPRDLAVQTSRWESNPPTPTTRSLLYCHASPRLTNPSSARPRLALPNRT